MALKACTLVSKLLRRYYTKASNVGMQINVTAKVAVALSTVDPLVYVAEQV